MSATNEHGLSKRQKAFADFYLDGLERNVAAGVSYVRAGYSINGAAEGASRLLKNEKVSAYIDAEQEWLSEKTRMKRWQAIEMLSENLTTPIGDLDERSTLVQEHTVDRIGEEIVRTKIKMIDKLGSLDRIARMLGWYEPEKHQVELEIVIGGKQEA